MRSYAGKLYVVAISVLMLALIAAQCSPAPTPETVTVVETVVVEKEVQGETVTVVETVVVEKEVVKEVEVEKVVTVEVEAEEPARPYEGVEINIVTFTGPWLITDRWFGIVDNVFISWIVPLESLSDVIF